MTVIHPCLFFSNCTFSISVMLNFQDIFPDFPSTFQDGIICFFQAVWEPYWKALMGIRAFGTSFSWPDLSAHNEHNRFCWLDCEKTNTRNKLGRNFNIFQGTVKISVSFIAANFSPASFIGFPLLPAADCGGGGSEPSGSHGPGLGGPDWWIALSASTKSIRATSSTTAIPRNPKCKGWISFISDSISFVFWNKSFFSRSDLGIIIVVINR